MKLEIVDSDENYPIIKMISENNRCELGIAPFTIFGGIRINAGLVGSRSYTIVYCCGQNIYLAVEVLKAVTEIFLYLHEEVEDFEVNNLFPQFDIKPINLNNNYSELNDLVLKMKSDATEEEKEINDRFLKILEVTARIVLEGSVFTDFIYD